MIYAGFDIGTTGSKITIFNDLDKVDTIYQSYPSIRNSNEHVLDGNDILNTVYSLIKKAVLKYPSLRAIGFTSFGEAFVVLDKNDNILLKTMLYTDPRGTKEAKLLERKIGKSRLGEITGQVGLGMFSLPKLMYIKKHNPNTYQKIDKVLLIEDFIVYMLTGVRQIDYSLASRTLGFDVINKCWSKEIFDCADIDMSLFSTPVPTGTSAGFIKKEVKELLEITNDIEIINIAHDQIANAVGASIFDLESAADGLGTCECNTILFDENIDKKFLSFKGYGVIPYIKENQYVCYALINTGGALIEWVINNYFSSKKNQADLFEELNANVSDKPTKVMFVPHLAGASVPFNDPLAKGAIINLDLGTNGYEIYQAALESLSYEMKYSLDRLEKAGVTLKRIYASGGGAKNDTWLQIKADIYNLPIYQLETRDAGTVGSAMIVGVAIGLFKDLEEAASKMIKVKKIFTPNEEKSKLYKKVYRKYCKLYRLLKEVR